MHTEGEGRERLWQAVRKQNGGTEGQRDRGTEAWGWGDGHVLACGNRVAPNTELVRARSHLQRFPVSNSATFSFPFVPQNNLEEGLLKETLVLSSQIGH